MFKSFYSAVLSPRLSGAHNVVAVAVPLQCGLVVWPQTGLPSAPIRLELSPAIIFLKYFFSLAVFFFKN